jgi:hypothetical protein
MKTPDATVTVVPELDVTCVARDARRIATAWWNMAEELDPLEHHAFHDGSDGEMECSECGDGPDAPQHFERVAVR